MGSIISAINSLSSSIFGLCTMYRIASNKFIFEMFVPGMLEIVAFNSATHLLRLTRLDSVIVASLINFTAVGTWVIQ